MSLDRQGRRIVGYALTSMLCTWPRAATAGVHDTPLPTFSTARPAVLVAVLPVVIRNNGLDTLVACTNHGTSEAVDIGVEVFDAAGTRANSVEIDNGAIINVGVGATVTIATGATAALHEDAVIVLEPPVVGPLHGTGRVVASAATVSCVAWAVDDLHDFRDPAKRPDAPPSIGPLEVLPPEPPETSTTTVPGGTTTSSTLAGTTTTSSTAPGTTTTTSSTLAGGATTTTTTVPPSLCPPAPPSGCRLPALPAKAKLIIRDLGFDAADQLAWKWTHGLATAKADFGMPTVATSYAVCVYAGGTLVRGVSLPAGGTCGTKPCWSEVPSGFKWNDPGGAELQKALFKAGGNGLAKIAVKGKGGGVRPPALPLTPPVRVQLRRPDLATVCWEAVFSVPAKNQAGQFSGKAD